MSNICLFRLIVEGPLESLRQLQSSLHNRLEPGPNDDPGVEFLRTSAGGYLDILNIRPDGARDRWGRVEGVCPGHPTSLEPNSDSGGTLDVWGECKWSAPLHWVTTLSEAWVDCDFYLSAIIENTGLEAFTVTNGGSIQPSLLSDDPDVSFEVPRVCECFGWPKDGVAGTDSNDGGGQSGHHLDLDHDDDLDEGPDLESDHYVDESDHDPDLDHVARLIEQANDLCMRVFGYEPHTDEARLHPDHPELRQVLDELCELLDIFDWLDERTILTYAEVKYSHLEARAEEF